MTAASQPDPLFIGVDGGGTGCRARIEDAQGCLLGTGIAGPAAGAGLADLDRLYPDVRPSRLVDGWRRVDWCTNPNTRGGYSFVRYGGAGSRAALAASDTGALFWAGDATSTTTIAAVVHAAYASGRRAASEVLARV